MMAKYKTEKRKANVGERILITDAELGQRHYKNGNTATVSDKKTWVSSLLYVNEWEHSVHELEYEVIVETPKIPDRITALETEVAELTAKVEALEKAKVTTTTVYNVNPTVNKDVEVRKIAEAFSKLLSDALPPKPRSMTPNERRADVIKRAKAFVAKYPQGEIIRDKSLPMVKKAGSIKTELHVNAKKRVVTAVVKWANIGDVRDTIFAKCDPSDVFNADIGKAIALGRALGVDVAEFERAVQPTEVVVGHIITFPKDDCDGWYRKVCYRVDDVISPVNNITIVRDETDGISIGAKACVDFDEGSRLPIIEDTDADYVGTYK